MDGDSPLFIRLALFSMILFVDIFRGVRSCLDKLSPILCLVSSPMIPSFRNWSRREMLL